MPYLYYTVCVIAQYFSPLLSVCLVMRSSHGMGQREEEREREKGTGRGQSDGSGNAADRSRSPHGPRWKSLGKPDDGVPKPLISNSTPKAPLVSSPLSMWETHLQAKSLGTFLTLKFSQLLCENTNKNAASHPAEREKVPLDGNSSRGIYTDNFYTSPLLYTHLSQQGFGACGTYRQGRVPTTQENALTKRSPRGSIWWVRDGDLLFVKLMDTREVSLCSTIHLVYSVETVLCWQKMEDGTKQKISVPRPTAITEYNEYMGGVDTSDQMIGTNSVHHKTKRWTTTVFQHVGYCGHQLLCDPQSPVGQHAAEARHKTGLPGGACCTPPGS